MGGGEFETAHDLGFRHRHAIGLGNPLGLLLVHRQRRRQNAGMGVGDLQIFQDALDGAILAKRSMQRIERHIRLQFGKHRGNITSDIHFRDIVALGLKRNCACGA